MPEIKPAKNPMKMLFQTFPTSISLFNVCFGKFDFWFKLSNKLLKPNKPIKEGNNTSSFLIKGEFKHKIPQIPEIKYIRPHKIFFLIPFSTKHIQTIVKNNRK